MDCLLTIAGPDSSCREVSVTINGNLAGKTRFSFNPDGQSLQKSFQYLQMLTCSQEHIRAIGEQLFLALFPRELRDVLSKALKDRSDSERKEPVRLRLVIPPELRWLPWEALFYGQLLDIGARKDWTLYHEPPAEDLELLEFPGPSDGKLRLLHVVPAQTNLDFAEESQIVRRALERLGDKVIEVAAPDGALTLQVSRGGRTIAEFVSLRGAITLTDLSNKLSEGGWDIVHYIGHGEVDARTGVRIFLNASSTGGEAYATEGQLARSFIGSGARLVVLSCCFGASAYYVKERSLSGLGPHLLRAGVPAVVAMRYVVSDPMAKEFSRSFYDSLFHRMPGQVDVAIQHARAALACIPGEESRAYITPVLYATSQGIVLPVPEPNLRVKPDTSPDPNTVDLPIPLVEALQKGDCLVIAGSRLLQGSGGFRDTAQISLLPPTLETLARDLSRMLPAQPYPRSSDLDTLKDADDGGAWEVFERVCQYFKSRPEGGRLNLESHVGDKFVSWAAYAPDIFRRIADWRVPGIVYTYFDGYLRDAAAAAGDWEIKDSPRQEVTGARRTLVLLRGIPRERSTLRLTREDAWDVLESISHMHPSVKKLARDRSRALLLIGIAPSDALAQFLVNVLLGDETQREEKPVFFACAEPDPVIRACWHRFKKLEWLGDQPLDRFVRTVDGLVPRR